MIELAGGLGYSVGARFAHGPVEKSLEHQILDVRLIERLGLRCRLRSRPGRSVPIRAVPLFAQDPGAALPACAQVSAA